MVETIRISLSLSLSLLCDARLLLLLPRLIDRLQSSSRTDPYTSRNGKKGSWLVQAKPQSQFRHAINQPRRTIFALGSPNVMLVERMNFCYVFSIYNSSITVLSDLRHTVLSCPVLYFSVVLLLEMRLCIASHCMFESIFTTTVATTYLVPVPVRYLFYIL